MSSVHRIVYRLNLLFDDVKQNRVSESTDGRVYIVHAALTALSVAPFTDVRS